MKLLNKMRKAQGLPLNTIVIAILVIIVLLVIIVFFTSQVGDTGTTLNENSPVLCDDTNPALATLYTNVEDIGETGVCDENEVNIPGMKNRDGVSVVCCGTR